ncbi:MAG: hypothetical protein EA361_10130 [Bacteroidetes bacterium]|nr:MAG: hypothetical protein EA361_10130 [Bacteroidota bacterium]
MKGMSVIVKKVAQLLSAMIFVFGMYIITHGHILPGGGFAGGVLLASSFIVLILAQGLGYFQLKKQREMTSLLESLSALIILLLGFSGLFAGSLFFFNNYLPKGEPGELLSAGNIPIYSVLIGIKVAATLFTIFLALTIYKEEVSK